MRQVILKVVIVLILVGLPIKLNAQEYKDVSPKIKNVIKNFKTNGVLNGFIGKYGKGYFRPTATIKREDLIMALHEYDKFTRTLMEYQRVLDKKMRSLTVQLNKTKQQLAVLRKGGVGKENMAIILSEVKKELPLLAKGGSLTQKTEERLDFLEEKVDSLNAGKSGGRPSVGAIARIIRTSPQVKMVIRKEVGKVLGKSPSSSGVKGTVDMKKIIREIKKDLPRLMSNIPIPKKIQAEFIAVKEKVNLLEELSEEIGEDMFANMLNNSRKVKNVLTKQVRRINAKKKKRR
ncbi:S-layer homology domain-containing protein [bacterium]|nr:S-layer homology domain-containing protein [bacterium]